MTIALLGTFMSGAGTLVLAVSVQKKVSSGFVLAGLLLAIGLSLVM